VGVAVLILFEEKLESLTRLTRNLLPPKASLLSGFARKAIHGLVCECLPSRQAVIAYVFISKPALGVTSGVRWMKVTFSHFH